MKPGRKEWSVSEARNRISDLISDAFDEPQIIVDRKTREPREVAVIPVAMLEQLQAMAFQTRNSRLDELFLEMQSAAKEDGHDGESEILLPRGQPKPIMEFDDGK